jgi:WD40 repeat protein
VVSIAFAPKGERLASASLDGSIRLWSSGNGKEVATIPVNDRGLVHVGYSPDGSRLLGCLLGGALAVIDVSNNNRVLSTSVGKTFQGGQQCADFNPVADQLAWISDDNQIVFLTRDGGPTAAPPLRSPTAPQVIAYSPDGAMLAVGDNEGDVTLRAVDGSSNIALLPGLAGPCQAIAWAAKGRFVAAANRQQLLVWRTDQPQKPVQVLHLASDINRITFTPDGQRLIAAQFGEVTVIEPFHGGILARFNPSRHFDTHVTAIAIDPDGFRLALGGDHMPVELFSLEKAIEAHTLRSPDRSPGDNSFTPRIAFSPDGRIAAVTSYDARIRLWDLENGQVIDTIDGTFNRNDGLFYSADGRSLITGSPTGDLRTVDLASRATRAVNVIPGRPAYKLTPSPDGKRYAFTTTPGTDAKADASAVGIWDVAQHKIEAVLPGHARNIEALAFHPTKPLLASASYDRTARIWNLSTPGQFIELEEHGGTVTAVAFSPDGIWLATACRDGAVRVFAVDSGKMTKMLRVADKYAEAVAFTPDGKLLATGGWNGSAQLWRVPGWQPVIRLFGHQDGWIQNVAIDSKGKWLLTSSQDEWIRAWRLPGVIEFAAKSPKSIIKSLEQRIGWREIDLTAGAPLHP